MECLRCGNKDPTYFYNGSKGYYCRKCISFKRILLLEEPERNDYEISSSANEYHFDYALTPYQEKAASEVLNNLKNNSNVLLKCVCGSGKTEITVKSISDYLSRGLKVCYAIARKEVVKELTIRFKKVFSYANVASVYGGHHDEIHGDLIICTTHQLFRYYKTFDLLIIDEVDAYPLDGNETLMNIALNSCKGNIIFSTATTNDFLLNYLKKRKYKEVSLDIRPSYKPLIIPKVIYTLKPLIIFILIYLLNKQTNQCIIFIQNKKKCLMYYKLLKRIFSITYTYADLKERDNNIIDFKNKKYKFILSTTVLERGITIKDVDVIIVNDRKESFSKSSLIQMTGRVGRSISNPYGKAYIISSNYSKEIDNCIKSLKEANKKLEMSILR